MLDPKSVLVACLACAVVALPPRQETALRLKWDELSPEVLEERASIATTAAKVYVKALMGADLEAILSTSDVPYALDRKQVVETKRELREVFLRMTERGPVGMEASSTEVIANRRGIGDDCVPVDYVIVRVGLGEGDERADLCVRMGAKPLVVGLSD